MPKQKKKKKLQIIIILLPRWIDRLGRVQQAHKKILLKITNTSKMIKIYYKYILYKLIHFHNLYIYW